MSLFFFVNFSLRVQRLHAQIDRKGRSHTKISNTVKNTCNNFVHVGSFVILSNLKIIDQLLHHCHLIVFMIERVMSHSTVNNYAVSNTKCLKLILGSHLVFVPKFCSTEKLHFSQTTISQKNARINAIHTANKLKSQLR